MCIAAILLSERPVYMVPEDVTFAVPLRPCYGAEMSFPAHARLLKASKTLTTYEKGPARLLLLLKGAIT